MVRLFQRSSYFYILCSLNLLAFLFLVPSSAFSEGRPKTLSEIHLDAKHFEEIKSDLPAKSITIDDSDHIWFLGTHFLWRWDPVRNTMQQITLTGQGALKQLAMSGNQIFAASDTQLFQVNVEPFRVTSYPSPNTSSLSLGLVTNSNGTHWVKTDGVYELSSESTTLKKILNHTLKDSEGGKFLYVPENKTLWFTRNRELSYVTYTSSNKAKKYWKIEKNISDIQRAKDDIYAISKISVFRYNQKGKLIQTVSVNKQRRIVLSTILPNAHVYIFQDRLLEVHIPSEKKNFHFFMDIGRVHKAGNLFIRNSYLSVILDGTPRVFKFSNPGLTS